MLFELRIVNFALIEQLNLQFQSGFTVLTGETGAGKSLLIDAIALLVGGRASTDQIRSGEEEAQLEASFHLPDTHPLIRRLRAQDLIGPHGSELILRRVLSRSGRHRVYVNGTLCPLRVLEELGGTLIDIHGQHEQQSLLASAKQGDALDAFGRLHELRGRYEQAYQSWRDLRAQLAELQSEVVDRARIEDMLRFQSQEIAQACLLPDEEDQLRNERQRLVHAHRLRALAHEVHGELQEDEQAVLTRLGRIGRALAELAQTDPAMGDCEQTTTQSAIQLKDLAGRLRDGALDAFRAAEGDESDLVLVDAPGSFELVALAHALTSRADIDAVVCLGCVLTGETTHDQYICQAVAAGLAEITARNGKPIAFGVLTCQSIEQARARAGGEKGNKGEEAMNAAIIAAQAVGRVQKLPPGRPA
jgi:DNA repair protein RecN